ncbi:MAG: universal stress protein [Thermoleophilaceae bacterium]|nr:universal stress protein [Thermoleophilaceae bacterium]
MWDTILIGYDGSDEGADALALARVLAGGGRARLLAACVAPLPHLARDRPGLRERLEEQAEQTLAELAGEDVDTRAIVAGSPGRGLFELAEAESANLLVVGSSHRAGLGAVLAGSVGRALLHGAPCEVAVAPRGYRDGGADRLRVIGVGYNGTPESEAALDRAIELALDAEATMRVMTVIPSAVGPDRTVGSGRVSREPTRRDVMQQELHAAVDRCPPEVRALPQALTGNPLSQLIAGAQQGVDVLVLGSRGYGSIMGVMLGSVTEEIVRRAPCPVLVFPRARPGSQNA